MSGHNEDGVKVCREDILSDYEFEKKSRLSQFIDTHIPFFKSYQYQREKDRQLCATRLPKMLDYNGEHFHDKLPNGETAIIFSEQIPACRRLGNMSYTEILRKQ